MQERYTVAFTGHRCIERFSFAEEKVEQLINMIDRADLLICYVEKNGGACQTMKYAVKKGKKVINICTLQ